MTRSRRIRVAVQPARAVVSQGSDQPSVPQVHVVARAALLQDVVDGLYVFVVRVV